MADETQKPSHILPEHDVRPYSVAQLADRWGCSDSMIRKLINQGQLKCFRLGSLIRIAATEVAAYEARVTNETPSPEPAIAFPAPRRRKVADVSKAQAIDEALRRARRMTRGHRTKKPK